MIKPNVVNEYGNLKQVMLLGWEGGESRIQLSRPDQATRRLIKGQLELAKIIKQHGAEVVYSEELFSQGMPDVVGQVFVRDHFAVIGDKLLLCPYGEGNDHAHWSGATKVLGDIATRDIIRAPGGGTRIHGGDVIMHDDTIYVGQGGFGTNPAGLEFIEKTFGGDFNVIPIRMLRQSNGEPYLHLDTLFNPLSEDEAIIYEEGIEEKSLQTIGDRFFDFLPITKWEQRRLGANVLNLGGGVLVSQKMHGRINQELEDWDFDVERVDFSDTLVMGGAFRCATVPLVRDAKS